MQYCLHKVKGRCIGNRPQTLGAKEAIFVFGIDICFLGAKISVLAQITPFDTWSLEKIPDQLYFDVRGKPHVYFASRHAYLLEQATIPSLPLFLFSSLFLSFSCHHVQSYKGKSGLSIRGRD